MYRDDVHGYVLRLWPGVLNMRRTQTGKLALCGLMGALAVVMMLTGSILPFATFCAPAISGIFLVPVAVECGMKLAWVLYAAVALISALFVPDKEMAFIFIFLLGYYPLLKARLDRVRSVLGRRLAKAAVFNAAVFSMYWVLLKLFPLAALVEEFSATGAWMLAALVVLGNVTFVIYDIALVNILRLYLLRVRPHLRLLH